MSITNKAMIVSVTIRAWSGLRLDKDIARRAADDVGAMRDAVRASVELVPKAALEPIHKAGREARAVLNNLTAPWSDNGQRLMPADNYERFIKDMAPVRARFNTEVEVFLESYLDLVRDAINRLGRVFNRDHYPTLSRLKTKFGLDIEYLPIPESRHMIVDLHEETLGELRNSVSESMRRRFGDALLNVAEELHRHVTNMREALAKPDGRVFQSTLENIQMKAGLLQQLNIDGDERVTSMVRTLSEVAALDVTDLRKNQMIRQSAANTLTTQIDALASAFPGLVDY